MFNKQMTTISIQQLLEQLQQNCLIEQENLSKIEKETLDQKQCSKTPWYLRSLMVLGGLFFSYFFITFLYMTGTLRQEESLTIWGIIFVGFAIFLHQFILNQNKNSPDYNFFLLQISFNFMVVGKIAFVLGCAAFFASTVDDIQWVITGAILLITVLTYPIYAVSWDRMLSSFVTVMAISISILTSCEKNLEWQGALLELFFLLQVIVTTILCTHGKIKKTLEPLNYAMITAIFAQIILWTLIPKEDVLRYLMINMNVIKAILTVTLILLIAWAAGSIEKLRQEPLVIAILGAIALGIVSSVGIILVIILLILGYAKHDRPIIFTAILFLPVFLFFYYYDLELTLLNKSVVLVASGVILLMGYFYLKFRQWEQIGK